MYIEEDIVAWHNALGSEKQNGKS